MPPKRRAIGRSTPQARKRRALGASESDEQRALRLENLRVHATETRSSESSDQREVRLETDRIRTNQIRSSETTELRERRLQNVRISTARSRRTLHADLNLSAFHYDSNNDYSLHPNVVIGKMDKICMYCSALKFKNETRGMCCASGKVKLPELHSPPEALSMFLSGVTRVSKHFLENIRKYNSCFQMTSFGATNIVRENYMPTFRVQGQIYHHAGSLLPLPDADHKFLQIYFMANSDEQIEQRCHYNAGSRREIVGALQGLFDQHNELVRLFKTAIQRMPADDYAVVIRADKRPVGQYERQFNVPTIDEVAIVIVGEEFESRDIILHRRSGDIQRVSETHRSYDGLQYPILFWRGDDGYHFNIKMINPQTCEGTNKKVSAMNYYSYRLMIRQNAENHILKCRQLFHQYIVDMYAKIETERLLYIRLNQTELRSEQYIHLRDAIVNDANVNPNELGRMTILPSTFTGSPRHMHEYAQDAMTYVRAYGRPDLFVTFTCNPTWNEIKELLLVGQSSSDRHDITTRVFKQKLKCLMDFIIKHRVFGETRCWMYSIEWQKRGLPHAHILVWLINKITPDQIDQIISAEIPDKHIDPNLFDVVTKNMIHGPCGAFNNNSPCMSDGKGTKRYPRKLVSDTITGNDGYPLYRRRSVEDGGKSVVLKVRNIDIEVDNRWIVPYSPLLSKTFKAHINVEYCNSVKSIKYICKYVNKGSNMEVFGVGNVAAPLDEINQYQLERYISSNEAVWRILSFPIHERHPTVVHLAVHLENGKRVYFTADNFQRRKQGKAVEGHTNLYSSDALGRLYTVHPNNTECFYLRLLLINIRGPISFQDLRTVNGQLCATYRQAYQELNLLENDAHWDTALADASNTARPQQIRTLFAIILTTCFPSNPKDLWRKYKDYMSEDILQRLRAANQNPDIQFTPNVYNEALILIEDIGLTIANKALVQLGMPASNRPANNLFDRDLQRETHYDSDELGTFVRTNLPQSILEQRIAYDRIMRAITEQSGGLFFIDAPGGTGKTFILSLNLATIRSQNNIALAIASSGIAATLLDGGRTTHSALKLPLNLQNTEAPTCNISKNSGMGKVLQTCQIIIWDECTMSHKKALEALDRTLRDFRGNRRIFGGALILLSGDFRQTLPIIPRSTPADELHACLKSSVLWRHLHKLDFEN
ncbi:ATP-dependent DNA helicase [Trichonephila clavipes]|nr:ATP-dependent DNA helicase [Trichonephila clavipes]